MKRSELAAVIDHTLLDPCAGELAHRRLCEEALEHGFASVCVAPRWLPLAQELLGSSKVAIGCVASFPLGHERAAAKASAIARAVEEGAQEIDMVASLSLIADGDWSGLEQELRLCWHAARTAKLKVIIESALWTRAQISECARVVAESGAAFVKTSTGFSAAGGASIEAVQCMHAAARAANGACEVKASGGIRDLATARAMLNAGATRLGASAGLKILGELAP